MHKRGKKGAPPQKGESLATLIAVVTRWHKIFFSTELKFVAFQIKFVSLFK